jgi:hypothetical protein
VRVGAHDDGEEAWAPRAPDLAAAAQHILESDQGAP